MAGKSALPLLVLAGGAALLLKKKKKKTTTTKKEGVKTTDLGPPPSPEPTPGPTPEPEPSPEPEPTPPGPVPQPPQPQPGPEPAPEPKPERGQVEYPLKPGTYSDVDGYARYRLLAPYRTQKTTVSIRKKEGMVWHPAALQDAQFLGWSPKDPEEFLVDINTMGEYSIIALDGGPDGVFIAEWVLKATHM